LKKGEEPQFGKWLKWVPPKRQKNDFRQSWHDGGNRRQNIWNSGGSKSGSDAPSWRKNTFVERNENIRKEGVEKEATTPSLITSGKEDTEAEVTRKLGIDSNNQSGDGCEQNKNSDMNGPQADNQMEVDENQNKFASKLKGLLESEKEPIKKRKLWCA
jgi:hypothetical protein